jgi:H+/Cl- antiporter ClcA
MRSRQYRILLVVAAVIGVVVSFASWCFLELVRYLQQWVFVNLPSGLGYKTAPDWWPLPVLAVAGVVIALAIVRLPGNGGHQPADGLDAAGGPTKPLDLPGIVLAALASIGLGMVLGPEAPLIALGTGLGVLAVKSSRKELPDQVVALLAAAATFAAISSLFGSPIIGAVIIIEATGLGGPTLPVILLPGLLSAGIGSLVFIGMGSLSGLSSSAYGVSLGSARGGPTFPAMFLGIIAALLAGHLPGFAQTPAVAALMGAGIVSVLRLPLASVLIAMFASQAGLSTGPLVIVAVVVAYITVLVLSARLEGKRATSGPAPLGPAAAAVHGSTEGSLHAGP